MLLYSREGLHRFVRSGLTEAELRDALIFAGATLVVLPLLPDDPLDPYGVLNLRKIWIVVVLIMAISGAGYIAVRLLGVRFGLPVSGFASGFVSSSATIAAMASRVKETPGLLRPAAAGAVLSTVATIVQLALLLAAVNMAVLGELAIPLALSGLAAVLYGGAFTLWALKHEGQGDDKPGRAFSLATALALAAHPGGDPGRLGGPAKLARRGRPRDRRRRGGLRRHPFGGGIGRVARAAPTGSTPIRRCCRCSRRSAPTPSPRSCWPSPATAPSRSASCRAWCWWRRRRGLGFVLEGGTLILSLTLRQQVDLDHRAARQAGDADAGAGRPTVGREIAGVDLVHARIVRLEVGEIDARADHVLEPELQAAPARS